MRGNDDTKDPQNFELAGNDEGRSAAIWDSTNGSCDSSDGSKFENMDVKKSKQSGYCFCL